MKITQPDEVAILEVPKVIPYSARKISMRMYWAGYDCEQIAAELYLNPKTVRTWKTRDEWDKTPIIRRIEEHLDARLCQLIQKDKKTGADFKEIDLLTRQVERLARVRRFEQPGGHEGDLNPNIANRNAKPKKKPKKNYIDEVAKEQILAAIDGVLFIYQRYWVENGHHRNRFIIKSRQIGATFAFALEALKRALETGHNEIFISASRNQANNFKIIIVNFVERITGIRLDGDPMKITVEGVEDYPTFFFLGTNYMTAQGYSGDLYMDECFWIRDFSRVKKVVSAVATLKQFRRTYFSTPSTKSHEAYQFWSGEEYNKRKPKDKQVTIIIDGDGIKKGILGGDRIWRQIVTIEDAIAQGNDKIDLEEIRDENSEDTFDNLYLCKFVDDSKSSFPLSMVSTCMIDAWEKWKDYKEGAFNHKYLGGVIIAIDPSRSAQGDPAAILIIKPPTPNYPKFRILEKHKFRGLDFEKINDFVKDTLAKKYNIDQIIIDSSGIGAILHDLMIKWFPRAIGLRFDPFLKSQMVHKGQLFFRSRKIEFDAGWVDVANDLRAIHPKLTKTGGQLTYDATRANGSHGEYGWCLLLSLHLAPVDGDYQSQTATVEIG